MTQEKNMTDFDEWLAQQPDANLITPRMAWEAGSMNGGLQIMKTTLRCFDILNCPERFRMALASAIAKTEKAEAPKH